MKKLFAFAVLALTFMMSFAQPASAPAPAKQAYPKNALAGGGSGGTYSTITAQYLAQCNTDGFFTAMNQPGGSPSTFTDIINNNIIGGIGQLDVALIRADSNPVIKDSIKVLVPLHKEQVHVIALAKNPKTGGFLGFNQVSINLKDVSHLKGLTVAASGGSKFTAEAINKFGSVGFKLNGGFKDTAGVLDAIDKGEAVAGVFVGGAPMPDIEKLDPTKFRILPFDSKTISALKDVYEPATIQYDNFGTAGFASVQVPAYLFVNDFKGKAMSARLLELRKCITENVHDIAETRDAHRVWREIAKNIESKNTRWPLYVGRQ